MLAEPCRRHGSPASTPSARRPWRWPARRCGYRGTRTWTRQPPTCCSTASPPASPSGTGGRPAPRRGPGVQRQRPGPPSPGYLAPSSASSPRMTCGTTRDAGPCSCALRKSTAGDGHWARCGSSCGLSTSELWAGRLAESRSTVLRGGRDLRPDRRRPLSTGVLLDLRGSAGRRRAGPAATTENWGEERGAPVLGFFALIGLTVLELSLGRYAEALARGLPIYEDDPPGFGSRILPEIVEAGARAGDHGAALAALGRLADRATASGTPWALGLLARSRALLAPDSDAGGFLRRGHSAPVPNLGPHRTRPCPSALRRMAAPLKAPQPRQRAAAHGVR